MDMLLRRRAEHAIQTLPAFEISVPDTDLKLDQDSTLKDPGLWSEPHPRTIGSLFRYSGKTRAAGD